MLVAIWNSDRTTKYELELSEHDGRLVIVCSCPAGKLGKLCRHKRMVLAGDLSALREPSSVASLSEKIEQIDLRLIHSVASSLSDAELRVESAKKEVKRATKAFEQLLINGVPIVGGNE